jgi:uncharacterized membrane protein YqaE (UPF0057 family)
MKKITTRLLILLMLLPVSTIPVMASSLPETHAASTTPDKTDVKAAVKEFKSLPRRERKAKIKDAKKLLKEYRADKRAGRDDESDTVLLVILAILLPPLAVYLHEDEVNSKFWISLILTLLFWIPGVVYALLVIFDAA